MMRIILSCVSILVFGVVSNGQDDLEKYKLAINWIQRSQEVKELTVAHLSVSAVSDSLLRFAVLDTIVPNYSFRTYDSETCSLVTDPSLSSKIRKEEFRNMVDVEPYWYPPFSGLWNDSTDLILIFGNFFRNTLAATIYLRPEPPVVKNESGTSLEFSGVKIRGLGSPRSVQYITWNAVVMVQIVFCFDQHDKIVNSSVFLLQH
jgi:hypothetical protein